MDALNRKKHLARLLGNESFPGHDKEEKSFGGNIRTRDRGKEMNKGNQ